MSSIWVVVGTEPEEAAPSERGRAFATEDAAYAALGRIAYKAGAVGDLAVHELDVVGGQVIGPDGPPLAVPGWVKRVHGETGDWSNGRASSDPGVVQVRDADGDWRTMLHVSGGATSEEDREAAAWIAAVIQREASR